MTLVRLSRVPGLALQSAFLMLIMSCEDESSRARAMSKEAFAAQPSVSVEQSTASERLQTEIDARVRQKSEEDAAKTERLRKAGPAARLREAKLFADGCISANTCDSVVAWARSTSYATRSVRSRS